MLTLILPTAHGLYTLPGIWKNIKYMNFILKDLCQGILELLYFWHTSFCRLQHLILVSHVFIFVLAHK